MISSPAHHEIDRRVAESDFAAAAELIYKLRDSQPPVDFKSASFVASRLAACGLFEKALSVALDFLSREPDSIKGVRLAVRHILYTGEVEPAEHLLLEALSNGSGEANLQIDLAVCLSLRGAFDEAYHILSFLLESQAVPDDLRPVVDYNIGWHDLRQGRFKAGMRRISAGRSAGLWGTVKGPPNTLLRPGVQLDGKRIILCGEAGAGDEIINARFGKIIEERGGRPVWVSVHRLESVFGRSPGIGSSISRQELGYLDHDYWAPAMDLPWLLDVEPQAVNVGTYIFADPEAVEKWRHRLITNGKKLRVGLRWKGNPTRQVERFRAISFSNFRGLLDIPGVEFYSLQRDAGADELPIHSPVHDWGRYLGTWEDTAAAISQLDLVISSCTSIAHLAAAMGKTTWVICPVYAYYVWLCPEVAPWYPKVKLFRQERFGCWDEPLLDVATELRDLSRKGEVFT